MKKHYKSVWHSVKGIWYVITAQKRFRVLYEDDRFSKLMTYQQADDLVSLFGGQVCIDNNKKLQQ